MDTLPEPATGSDLAVFRRNLGLTQAQVADRLGVSRVTLATWEATDLVPAIKAERYRRAAEQAAREALVGEWTEGEKAEAWGK